MLLRLILPIGRSGRCWPISLMSSYTSCCVVAFHANGPIGVTTDVVNQKLSKPAPSWPWGWQVERLICRGGEAKHISRPQLAIIKFLSLLHITYLCSISSCLACGKRARIVCIQRKEECVGTNTIHAKSFMFNINIRKQMSYILYILYYTCTRPSEPGRLGRLEPPHFFSRTDLWTVHHSAYNNVGACVRYAAMIAICSRTRSFNVCAIANVELCVSTNIYHIG